MFHDNDIFKFLILFSEKITYDIFITYYIITYYILLMIYLFNIN